MSVTSLSATDIAELTRRLNLPPTAQWHELVARRNRSVWRVDYGASRFTVRVFRPDDHEGAAREQAAMAAARAAGLPVAETRGVTTIRDRPVLLADWCPGRALLEVLHERPWAARRLGRLFGELQARLHAASCEGLETSDWIGFFGSADGALRSRLENAGCRQCLIHLDYHPGNIVVRNGGIEAIIDWSNARAGDPRADLARTSTLLRHVFRSGRRFPVRRWVEDRFAHGWWDGYLQLAGPQSEMPLFLAWALDGLVNLELSNGSRASALSLMQIAQGHRSEAGLPFSSGRDWEAQG